MAVSSRQTLAQEIKDRKLALKDLSYYLRTLDSQIEKTQRLISRLRSRKTKLPNLTDLANILDLVLGGSGLLGIQGAFSAVVKSIEIVKNVFEAF